MPQNDASNNYGIPVGDYDTGNNDSLVMDYAGSGLAPVESNEGGAGYPPETFEQAHPEISYTKTVEMHPMPTRAVGYRTFRVRNLQLQGNMTEPIMIMGKNPARANVQLKCLTGTVFFGEEGSSLANGVGAPITTGAYTTVNTTAEIYVMNVGAVADTVYAIEYIAN